MAEEAVQQEEGRTLWRTVFTTSGGWGEAVPFAGWRSAAAPALAEVNGVLHCVHRGARTIPAGGRDALMDRLRAGDTEVLPVRWAWCAPAAEATADPEGVRGWSPDRPVVTEAVDGPGPRRSGDGDEDGGGDGDGDAQLRENGVAGIETPAVVADNGVLRMVSTRRIARRKDGFGMVGCELFETELVREADAGRSGVASGVPSGAAWRKVGFVTGGPERTAYREGEKLPPLKYEYAPALAVFAGRVHLVHVNIRGDHFAHLVRGADGTWAPATGDGGEPLTAPKVNRQQAGRDDRGSGLRANLSLAVHDGKLHLVHRLGDGPENTLSHCVFDGTAWTDKGNLPATHLSSRNAALASYGGKLHAVYPDADKNADKSADKNGGKSSGTSSGKLRHTWWTEADGWAEGVDLDGHGSDNTPALLVVKDGPEGQGREALLMVHRGVDR